MAPEVLVSRSLPFTNDLMVVPERVNAMCTRSNPLRLVSEAAEAPYPWKLFNRYTPAAEQKTQLLPPLTMNISMVKSPVKFPSVPNAALKYAEAAPLYTALSSTSAAAVTFADGLPLVVIVLLKLLLSVCAPPVMNSVVFAQFGSVVLPGKCVTVGTATPTYSANSSM